MRTDDLIADLSTDLAPIRPGASRRVLMLGLLAGSIVAAVMMTIGLGLRPDLPAAAAAAPFWMKVFYTLILAAVGFGLVDRVGRPGAPLGGRPRLLAAVVLCMAAIGAVQMLRAPADLRPALFLGGSHRLCPWLIVALSTPILAGLIVILRAMAPTRPMLAGGAAGLLAGSTGAWIYSLHCTESSAMFVAFWYTLGIAAVGVVGAICGRLWLRW